MSLVISEDTRRRGRHYARLGFMTAVTAVLLALVAEATRRGPAALPSVLVYAFAAGFGLEFVNATWSSRDGARQLPR